MLRTCPTVGDHVAFGHVARIANVRVGDQIQIQLIGLTGGWWKI